MTVESDSQTTERAIIITTNYGVQSDENSYCAPQHFDEAFKKKHKREGSLTGYTVIEGGVQWLTAKRVKEAYELFNSFQSLINSGMTQAFPDVKQLQQPIKLLQDAIPYREEEQQRELALLLQQSVFGHNISKIIECFYLLNVLYIPETVEEGTMPHPNTLGYHLSLKGSMGEPPQVINWLISSCILNEPEYQAICWHYIRENNLYQHINYPGNCIISISERGKDDHGVDAPTLCHVFAYKEILTTLAPELYSLLYSGQSEKIIYGYKPNVVCDIFDFLYRGYIEITPKNLIDILNFSNQYQIKALTELCKRWIEDNLEIFLSYENSILVFKHFCRLGFENVTELLCFRLISIIADCNRGETTLCDAQLVQNIGPLLVDIGQSITTFDVHYFLNHPIMSKYICLEDIDETFINIITRYCTRLKIIDVSSVPGINNKCLLQILTKCKELKGLNLSSCLNITSKGFTNAFKICNAKLTTLNLTSCNIKDGACFNTMDDNMLGLKELHLNHCSKLSEKEALFLFDRLPALTKLNLSGCKRIGDKVLLKISEKCTNIRELCLSDCVKVTDKGLNEIVTNLRSLTTLYIEGCKKVTDAPCYTIAKQLSEPTALYLSGTGVTDNAVSSMVLKLPNLTTLIISDTNATGVSLVSISRKANIQNIGIANCQDVRDEHIIELAQNNPNIQEFILEGCNLLTDNGLQYLIGTCNHLKVLSISGCRKISETMIQLIPSCTPLLQELHVEGCRDRVIFQAREIKRNQMPNLRLLS